MTSGIRAQLLVSAALLGCVAASPAFAQNQQPKQQAAKANNDDQAIVVTANKRPQVLIDVPQSITVISGATLENQQATNFQDYLKLVPGLQLDQSNPGEGRLILRGLNTGGVASSVAVYMDETPFGSSTGLVNGGVLAADFDTFDVNRVEVLRGPQGTLYGANSLGGLLKFVTNEPDTRALLARGRVSLEDTQGGDISYRGQAVVNVPISDTIAFRASGSYRKDGGFIDSVGTSDTDGFGNVLTSDVAKNINGSKSYGGRASLLFKPSDVFSFRLSADLQNIRTDSPTFVESDPTTLKSLHGGLTQSRFLKPFGDLDYRVYNALLNYDFGFATITSSTSFGKQDQTRRQDLTFNLLGLIKFFTGAFTGTPVTSEIGLDQNTNNKKFTQEIRLASHQSDRFEWLVGGYYTKEEGLIIQEFVGFDPLTGSPTVFPPLFTPLAKVNLTPRSTSAIASTSISAVATATTNRAPRRPPRGSSPAMSSSTRTFIPPTMCSPTRWRRGSRSMTMRRSMCRSPKAIVRADQTWFRLIRRQVSRHRSGLTPQPTMKSASRVRPQIASSALMRRSTRSTGRTFSCSRRSTISA